MLVRVNAYFGTDKFYLFTLFLFVFYLFILFNFFCFFIFCFSFKLLKICYLSNNKVYLYMEIEKANEIINEFNLSPKAKNYVIIALFVFCSFLAFEHFFNKTEITNNNDLLYLNNQIWELKVNCCKKIKDVPSLDTYNLILSNDNDTTIYFKNNRKHGVLK